jgi:hypothetical protein
VGGKSATTDTSGHVTITVKAKKTLTATVKKAGYATGTLKLKAV